MSDDTSKTAAGTEAEGPEVNTMVRKGPRHPDVLAAEAAKEAASE